MLTAPSSLQTGVFLLRDASNTLRSFFGTNILFMAWTMAQLGTVLGPITTFVCACVVYRATLCLIRVKQSLPHHESLVSFGAVLQEVASFRGRVVVDVLVGFTQFLTCVSYTAFSSKNFHNLAGERLSFEGCIAIVATVGCLASCFHSPFMLAKISVVTNLMMLTGITVILTRIDFHSAADTEPALPIGIPIGVATLSSALGGITTVLDVERTMTETPGRYLSLLRVVLPCAVVFLSAVGVMGYLTFGTNTCAVLSLSLAAGTWQQHVAQTVLSIGPGFESILNSFPLFVILEGYLNRLRFVAHWTVKRPLVVKCLYRLVFFTVFALVAAGVPFIGDVAALNGAIGYASLSFLVPAAAEWIRSRRKAETQIVGERSPILGPNRDTANGVQHGGEGTEETDKELAAAEDKEYPLSAARKVELASIFGFGVFVVVLGTVFAVKQIVAKEEASRTNSTHC